MPFEVVGVDLKADEVVLDQLSIRVLVDDCNL